MNKTELIREDRRRDQRLEERSPEVLRRLHHRGRVGAQAGRDQVQITGFGKFYVQQRDARQGINPQTKQRINIPASKVPKFTAGNALKDSIK